MNQLSEKEQSNLSGLTLLALRKLNDKERHLVNWVRHQQKCNLLDLAIHFCQDEETVLRMLSPLLKQGLIVEIPGEEESSYRVKIASKRGQKIPAKMQSMLQKRQAHEEDEED